MERFSGFLSGGAYLIYLGIGIIQLSAIYSFFHGSWGWHWIFAAPAAFVLGYMPIIGSICGILAAHDIWHWAWWKAVLLFCWPVVVVLAGMVPSIPHLLGKKAQRSVETPQRPLSTSIDGEPAPVEQEPQQNFALEQNQVPPSPQEQATGLSGDPGKKGFFYNLRMGNYSLAKTFWLYGVLFSVASGAVIQYLSNPHVAYSIFRKFGIGGGYFIYGAIEVLIIAYCVNVYIGIWRVADKYTGKEIWKKLAKIMVVIWWITLVLSVLQELAFILR